MLCDVWSTLIFGIYITYTILFLYSIYHWKKAICSLLLRIKFRVLRDNYRSFEHS